MTVEKKPKAGLGPIPGFALDRRKAMPALIGRHEDFLFIGGLGGASYDLIAWTNDGPNLLALGGAMGAASMMGLGLALARPDKRVIVATGDGELLMSVGSLCTIGVINPPNLTIICIDNGHYGETGYQEGHTARGVDLEAIAGGAGFKLTRTVREESEIAEAAQHLRNANCSYFIRLCVAPMASASVPRSYFNAPKVRDRFQSTLEFTA